VLERSPVPTIGVTGTAGKTTTVAFLAYLLRTAGSTVHTGTTARAGNLWPTAELLPPPADGVVLMELTSSHLCFTTHSPTIAVITCFWPDHLELHGSLERYRAAKEAIVRHQGRATWWSRTRTTTTRPRSRASRPAAASASRRRAR
jgi:UDP-N-acetylmuramoylalanine--D-glutamate ligase